MITMTIPVIPFLIGIVIFLVSIFAMADGLCILPELVTSITLSVISFFTSYGICTIIGLI